MRVGVCVSVRLCACLVVSACVYVCERVHMNVCIETNNAI